jgi:hypothetical protein
MFIAILVLLGIAGAIWYFARKQTQSIVTLTQEDVAVPTQEQKDADLKEAQLAALEVNKRLTKMTEKIDAVLTSQPEPVVEELPVVEEPVAKPIKKPVIEPVAIESVPEPTPVVSVLVTEEAKPAKKKRRYYPKKK